MIDTHCHIHSHDYQLDADEVIAKARAAGVERLICVGTSLEDSQQAVDFVSNRDQTWATIGLHPHEAADWSAAVTAMNVLIKQPKIVAVGECGLDYWYQNAPRVDQEVAFRAQLELGLAHNLPFVFHVRGSKDDPFDAFEDFFRIVSEVESAAQKIRGVVHSFTAGQQALEGVLSKSLLIGVNGIATFSKDQDFMAVLQSVPLDALLLETDAPYLTPVPKRGNVNAPEFMGYTAQKVAELRGVERAEIVQATTANAEQLFGI